MAADEGQIDELVRVGAEPLNSAPGAEEGSLHHFLALDTPHGIGRPSPFFPEIQRFQCQRIANCCTQARAPVH